MANYASLKSTIQTDIKSNHNQEITGPILQGRLFDMIASLGSGYQLVGAAVPASTPGTPDERVAYICATPGTYTGMGDIVVAAGEVAIIGWDTSWSKLASWMSGGVTLADMWASLTNESEDDYADVQINAAHLAGFVTTAALNETLASYVRNDAFDALTDLLAVHDGRITDLESLVASGGFGEGSAPDWFVVETYLDGVVSRQRLKLNPKYVGMYAEGYVSAGGLSEGSGGGGGVDLEAMWNSLTNSVPDDYANTPINIDHIPNITVSKVSDIESWISGKGYLTNADLSNYLPLTGGTMANTNLVTNMNADLLDGNHVSDILASPLTPQPINDLNDAVGWRLFYTTSAQAANRPGTGNNWVGGLTLLASNSNAFKLQFALGLDNDNVYYRRMMSGTWGSWGQLAYITSNVASATALKTSRSIWGQSFNGTTDVSGAMSGVSSIDSLLHFDTTNSGIYIGAGMTTLLKWDSVNNAWHLTGNFYADGFISAGGLSSGSGSGGIDLDAMWNSLTNSVADDYANTPINLAHIPNITVSKVSDIESWIAGKGYATNADLSNYLSLSGGTMANTNLVTNFNSDLLDGYHVSDILASSLTPQSVSDFNDATIWRFCYSSSVVANNRPTSLNSWYNGITLASSNSSNFKQQLAIGLDDQHIYFRNMISGTWRSWVQVANVTDNVASATALQTSRSIWGQSFNGTADVSGAMSGVSGIDSLLYFDTTNSGIYIGTGTTTLLKWDAVNNAWHLTGNFYADGFISAGGLSSGSGGGGIDLDAMWNSLTNFVVDDYANTPINLAHIPNITVSKVSDIESWIAGKDYITNSSASNTYLTISNASATYQPIISDLSTIRSNANHGESAYNSLSNYLPLSAGSSYPLSNSLYITGGNARVVLWGAIEYHFPSSGFYLLGPYDTGSGYRLGLYDGTGWRSIYHSNNANNTSSAWSASSLTLNGSITGATTISASGNINTSGQFVSTASSGAPLSVSSNTVVSNLNSDLLDGYHVSDILASPLAPQGINDLNDATGWRMFYTTTAQAANRPGTGSNWACGLTFLASNSTSFKLQFAFGLDNDNVYYRRQMSGTWSNWGQLAYLTSNVASATALQTSRTIWGQSFNGTSDVSGAISGATTISASGNISTSAQLISTASSGAPFSVSSNTVVSNLNADLVDGYNVSDILASPLSPQGINDLNDATGWRMFYTTTAQAANRPGTGSNWACGLTFLASNSTSFKLQFAFGLDNDNVYYRRQMSGSWSSWGQLAYLTSNVASATALQTSRNIWGQSFNGTADVSGALSGATTGSFSSWVLASYYYVGGTTAYLEYTNSALHTNVGFYSNSYISGGGLSTSSDIRIKTDIEAITPERAWSVIMGLRPTEFRWKESGEQSSGFIAQEVEPMLPFAVHEIGDLKRLNYDNVFTYGIAALRDMKFWRESTEQRIKRLEKKINELQTELNRLRA